MAFPIRFLAPALLTRAAEAVAPEDHLVRPDWVVLVARAMEAQFQLMETPQQVTQAAAAGAAAEPHPRAVMGDREL
jgi:hypothetical protein